MSAEEEVVYLEDIEPRRPSAPSGDVGSSPVQSPVASQSSTTSTTTKENASKSTGKRQMSLADMFTASGKSSEPNAKRLKSSSSLKTLNSSAGSLSSNKTAFGVQKLNSIPFSLKSFQDSLNEEEARLLSLECEVMGKQWLKILKDEIKKPYFLKLKRFLWEEGVRGSDDSPQPLKVYPSPRNIYAWSNTPLGKVKVVIIGQDPYHGAGQAHGLSFSVPVGVTIPPSLRNIYAEIKAQYPEFTAPKHGNLSAWASAGVLMLNSCLTVKAGSANSHSNKGWEAFTDKVIDVVDKYGGANLPDGTGSSAEVSGVGRGVVFLAWGAFAEKRVARLNKSKHLILTSAHPSPFAAHKGFFGNGHFKAANDWLEKKYGPDGCVDWCRLDV